MMMMAMLMMIVMPIANKSHITQPTYNSGARQTNIPVPKQKVKGKQITLITGLHLKFDTLLLTYRW